MLEVLDIFVVASLILVVKRVLLELLGESLVRRVGVVLVDHSYFPTRLLDHLDVWCLAWVWVWLLICVASLILVYPACSL